MQRNYSIKVLTTPPDHGERDFLPAYHFIMLQLPTASPSNGVTQNDLTLFNISEISCGASYMNTLCFTTQQANNNFLLHTQLPIILYTQLKTWQLKSLVTSNIFCVNVYIEVTVYSVPSLNYFMLWCISLYYAATVNHKSNATSEVRMQMISTSTSLVINNFTQLVYATVSATDTSVSNTIGRYGIKCVD